MRPAAKWGLIIAGSGAVAILGKLFGRKVFPIRWDVARIFGDASERFGFPRYWFPSIAWVESGGTFNPNLINMTGGDKLRDGAWGAGQITGKTARLHGFTGKLEELLDPSVNAEWMGRILSNPIDRNGKKRPKPASLIEAATMWNGGAYPGDKDMPKSTSGTYAPAVTSAANRVLNQKEIMA